jgi:hypothetical protein
MSYLPAKPLTKDIYIILPYPNYEDKVLRHYDMCYEKAKESMEEKGIKTFTPEDFISYMALFVDKIDQDKYLNGGSM